MDVLVRFSFASRQPPPDITHMGPISRGFPISKSWAMVNSIHERLGLLIKMTGCVA